MSGAKQMAIFLNAREVKVWIKILSPGLIPKLGKILEKLIDFQMFNNIKYNGFLYLGQ